MNWVILIIAGLFETFWAYRLKLSDGFSKLMPSSPYHHHDFENLIYLRVC